MMTDPSKSLNGYVCLIQHLVLQHIPGVHSVTAIITLARALILTFRAVFTSIALTADAAAGDTLPPVTAVIGA